MAISTPNQLMWRLVDETGQGADLVTFVLPSEHGNNSEELCLETDVIAALESSEFQRKHTDLQWSTDDLDLLLILMEKANAIDEWEDTISLDFNDASTIEIIHIVASARFSKPLDLTRQDMGQFVFTQFEEIEVGGLVCVNSKCGYKLAIVVALDSVDATCVMLEEMLDPDLPASVGVHDLVLLSRHDLLPSTFGSVNAGESDLIH